MLKINDLNFSYDDEKKILDGASFKIETGKIYCLLGVNGSGKTTLFNCITGFLDSNINIDKKMVNEEILYIHDEMSFYKNLTGSEFLDLILKLKKVTIDLTEYNRLVDELRMKEYIDNPIGIYSLGTKQKLVLIIGFLLNYKYILMDEPFGAIDFISAEVIIDTIRRYVNKGTTVVISTHLIDIAKDISDTILFLNNGKIYEVKNKFNTPDEMKNWIRGLI